MQGIRIPPYFCCPLSLELMLDPVIAASGQTCEQASVQKWLDHGVTTCPKTGQKLAHSNLIPNLVIDQGIEHLVFTLHLLQIKIQGCPYLYLQTSITDQNNG